MEIYPANSPPVPKTVFGSAPGEGLGHGRKHISTSPVMRMKRLPISPVVQTKPLTSPISTTRPLPTPFNAPTSPVLTTGDKPLYAMGARIGDTRGAVAWTVLVEGMGYGGCGLCDDGKGGWRKVHQEEPVLLAEEPMQEAEILDVGKELAEQVEIVVEMEQKGLAQDAVKDTISVSMDAEMEIAAPEVVKEKEEQVKVPEPEKQPEKEKVAPAEPGPVTLKKKDPPGKPRVPGSKPGLGGFKTNTKSAKSASKLPGPPSSKPGSPRPPSPSKPASLSGSSSKLKPIKTGSGALSMNGSPMTKPVELVPKAIEEVSTPPPSNAFPVAARATLPASSPSRPPALPIPSPPQPSTPSPNPGDDEINVVLWATEYDHIGGSIVDAFAA
ncbi:hypothetical protein RhiJN_08823 [Ceratobasidium sp. AG-Ba]|nr:hypothetical protein RhiJN_08823 [Ceratobasidium sp. AG-Ba]QRW09643.1 hypothetical protein RhiLY_08642 [Ceratobasidium sp. AG-Ba]